MFPLCSDENEPYPTCREDCEALFHECDSAMTEMMGVGKLIFEERGLNFSHVEVPRCTNHRYSHEYKAENKTCLHWGIFGKYSLCSHLRQNFQTKNWTGSRVTKPLLFDCLKGCGWRHSLKNFSVIHRLTIPRSNVLSGSIIWRDRKLTYCPSPLLLPLLCPSPRLLFSLPYHSPTVTKL